MNFSKLGKLPAPPNNKAGWPWTEASPQLPDTMPNGRAWPRISIVTPSYNQGQFIEETIRSVLLQGYPNLEYIIIDGGSTDKSVEIIKKYAPWLTYWVSEKDRGQSHAINKGFARARGNIVNWINSDDVLTPQALAIVAVAFSNCDALAGSVVNFSEHGEEICQSNVALVPKSMIAGEPNVVYQQPGFWMRRDLLDNCGGIDDQFQYAFDWDLTLRYLHLFPRVTYIPETLTRFRLHANSKTVSSQSRFDEERHHILRKLRDSEMFSALKGHCDRRLRMMNWWARLDRIKSDTSLSGWQQAIRIGCEMCVDPKVRFTRLSIGAVKQALQ